MRDWKFFRIVDRYKISNYFIETKLQKELSQILV